jgi:4-hydroxyproline epimerase
MKEHPLTLSAASGNATAAAPTRIIDSHTAGEPTRLVVSGGPDLGGGSMQQRLQRLRTEHDHWRRALVNEPRGNDVLVGALLCEPADPAHACGVIFFNNAGYLGMCGHGTIGLVASLAHLGRLQPGTHAIETPVGVVLATLHADHTVTVANVPSWRHARQVPVQVEGLGTVHGDVAWGGNWFFLCDDHGLTVSTQHLGALTERAARIRQALAAQGITGAGGAEVDHIELLGPSANGHDAKSSGRSFVLCPGSAYDRSPCGTGTSAKLACLAAAGKLAPGQRWVQESVIGSEFRGHYEWVDSESANGETPPRKIHPFIQGRAHVTLDAQVVFDPQDPLAWGMP